MKKPKLTFELNKLWKRPFVVGEKDSSVRESRGEKASIAMCPSFYCAQIVCDALNAAYPVKPRPKRRGK